MNGLQQPASRTLRYALSGWLVCLLVACVPQPRLPAEAPIATPSLDTGFFHQAAARNEPVYRIDRSLSNVWIRVDKAGPLAAAGHRHAVTAGDLAGFILDAPQRQRAELALRLDALIVDAPAARQHLGIDTGPDPSGIEATRNNMLKSLDAARYPRVLLRIDALRNTPNAVLAAGELFLHGRRRPVEIPVALDRGAQQLRISGRFHILQTDFGIEPFSALNGGLRVADSLTIEFELVAVAL